MHALQSRATFTLVPEVADALAAQSPATLLLAAGGIADGRGLAAALMLLDFTPTRLSTTPASCPAALDMIAQDKDRFGVLDLPRGYGEGNAAMMASVCHGKPIVQGETARHMADTLADRLVTTDLAMQRRQLAAAHVKYIVLHREQGAMHRWNRAEGVRADYPRHYAVVHDGKDMTVLRVY